MLSTDGIEIHQSQPLVWSSDLPYVVLAGCDWWISIRHVDNTWNWRKFWKHFRGCFVFQSRVSTKTVVTRFAYFCIIFFHRFRWYVTLESKIPAKTFPKFPSTYVLSTYRIEVHQTQPASMVTLVAVIGGFRSDLSITRMTDGKTRPWNIYLLDWMVIAQTVSLFLLNVSTLRFGDVQNSVHLYVAKPVASHRDGPFQPKKEVENAGSTQGYERPMQWTPLVLVFFSLYSFASSIEFIRHSFI